MRSYAYSEPAPLCPNGRARKLALSMSRFSPVEPSPTQRLGYYGWPTLVGDCLTWGARQATKLVREGQATAVKLRAREPPWARGRLAEELAQVDLPAALNLLRVRTRNAVTTSTLAVSPTSWPAEIGPRPSEF